MSVAFRRATGIAIVAGVLFLATSAWLAGEVARGASAIDSACAIGTPGGEHDTTSFQCPRGEYVIVLGEPDANPTNWDEDPLRLSAMSGVVSGFPDDFMEYPDARVWCGRTMLPNTRKPGCVLGEIALRAESVLELTLVSDRLSVGVRSTEWGPEELAIFQFARQIAFGLASLSFATGLMVAFLLRKRTGRG